MYKEKIYFTKEQLEKFLDYQNDRDKKIFNEMYENKDQTKIDIIEVVESEIFNLSDEILDIYVDYLARLDEMEDKRKGIVRGDNEFSTPYMHEYTDEEVKWMNRKTTEKELETYLTNIEYESLSYEELMKKRGSF